MSDDFKAILHSIAAPAGIPCTVVPRGTGLEAIAKGEVVARLDYTGISVSLTGVDDRYLCFEGAYGPERFRLSVPDKGIVGRIEAVGAPGLFMEALRRTAVARTRRSHGRKGILIGMVAVVGLGIALVVLALSWAVSQGAAMVPAEWESPLGRVAAAGILQNTKVCSDPELINATNEIGTRLVGGLSSNLYGFKLRILDDEEVNAFALPGGYLFVNRGLIEQADDGFEVAGVIAHEIQHVVLRHGVNNLIRQAGLMLLLRAFVGDASAVQQFLTMNAAELASMSFSRDQESEADSGGLALMRKAGMDASGLARFLDKMAKEEGATREILAFLTTHPASKERAEALRAENAKSPAYRIVPLGLNLKGLKGRCDPVALSEPDR